MGCGGSEEKETTVVTEEQVVSEEPPEGWLRVEVFCDSFVVAMYVGPEHKVGSLVQFVGQICQAEEGGSDCHVKGLTSTWALADGGLVFCEDDLIFELDGWDEADKNSIRLVAETDKNGVDKWVVEGAVPAHPSTEGFTLIETYEYKKSLEWHPASE